MAEPQPREGEDWVAISAAPLSLEAVSAWAVRPDCGALVVFAGTVRDHAEGRSGVTHLDYEAYAEQAEARLRAVVEETRRRWSDVGRVAVLHRVGRLELTEVSVLVVVSAPHRAEAFDAARFAIEAVKASVPIWKRESWEGGDAWGKGAQEVTEPSAVPTPTSGVSS